MTKPTRGGSRPGSGQPKKAPTKVITFRVRADIAEPFKIKAKAIIKRLTSKHDGTTARTSSSTSVQP